MVIKKHAGSLAVSLCLGHQDFISLAAIIPMPLFFAARQRRLLLFRPHPDRPPRATGNKHRYVPATFPGRPLLDDHGAGSAGIDYSWLDNLAGVAQLRANALVSDGEEMSHHPSKRASASLLSTRPGRMRPPPRTHLRNSTLAPSMSPELIFLRRVDPASRVAPRL